MRDSRCASAIVQVSSVLALLVVCAPQRGLAQELELELGEYDVPLGYTLMFGDIQMPNGIRGTFNANLWPNGVVPYQFDSNMTNPMRTQALAAMVRWEVVSDVQFVLRSGQEDHIHFRNSNGNNSPVGRQGGQQIINIVSWGNTITIAHEIGHSLGLWHEQSRQDRDNYVEILEDNIQNGLEFNFDIEPSSMAYGPYDFDSCMHYHVCAFSACCPPGFACTCPAACQTIRARPGYEEFEGLMGQTDHLSDWDERIMSFMYPPPCTLFVDPAYGGSETGTVVNPYNTFMEAYDGVCEPGTIWVLQAGSFGTNNGQLLDKRVTVRAANGTVSLTH